MRNLQNKARRIESMIVEQTPDQKISRLNPKLNKIINSTGLDPREKVEKIKLEASKLEEKAKRIE